MSRVVRLFGHPLHAILNDFPIVLFYSSAVSDAVALITADPMWWHMSFWMLCGGVGSALAAIVVGILDASRIDGRETASNAVVFHLICMLLAVGSAAGSIFARSSIIVPHGPRLFLALFFSGGMVLLLTVGTWYGRELVYRFGIGRRGPREVVRER